MTLAVIRHPLGKLTVCEDGEDERELIRITEYETGKQDRIIGIDHVQVNTIRFLKRHFIIYGSSFLVFPVGESGFKISGTMSYVNFHFGVKASLRL